MKNSQSGQSLVQLLVAVGIMGVVIMCFLTMMTSQQKESRALGETLARADLERLLIASMADGTVCKWVLNTPTPLTFNTTLVTPSTPQTITLPISRPLYANILTGPPLAPGPVIASIGAPASAFSNSLVISSIQLQIVSGSGDSYLGNWLIGFDNTKWVRAIRPASVAAKLTVDTNSPNSTTAAVITDCQGSGSISSFANCVERKATAATKGPCGFVSQVSCLPGETAVSGGMYGGGNDALQATEPMMTGTVPTGWAVTILDVGCAGNADTADGTVHNGSPPCFPVGGGSMCGAAVAVCCH